MSEAAQLLEPDSLPADNTLESVISAARASEKWDVRYRPDSKGLFAARVEARRNSLKQLEAQLAQLPVSADAAAQKVPFHSELLDLRANPRVLRTAVSAVADRPSLVARLPRVVSGQKEEPRVATIAAAYLGAVDGVFSGPALTAFIKTIQVREPLTIEELWYIAPFLKFVLLEMLLDEAQRVLHSPGSVPESKLAMRLKSLRTVTNTDWVYLIEPLILLDKTLRQDPAQAYTRMDFESRELYRKRISFVARHSDCNESEVAQIALDLARESDARDGEDPRRHLRRTHIGYYLIDKGFPLLSHRIGFHPPMIDRMRRYIRQHGEDFYITGIQVLSIFLIAAVLFPILPRSSGFIGLIFAFLVLLVPATQDAVDLANNSISTLFDPEPLPKFNFSEGIPKDCTTLVAIPSLLLNEEQVHELVNDLEVRFLANRDPNLHFALLTDLPDAVSEPRNKDTHPLVELAVRLIDGLNAKYSSPKSGYFLLLHRHRVFNRRQGVWMGWERKRGKLLDLNKLFAGEFDAFPIKAGRIDVLRNARFVLTLDTDTQLPRGVASKLVGAMAHPLNQAIIDPKQRVVTEGYGILQPRIGIAVQSASRSRLASIFSGQNGFDIYTRAISDAYQDLFGEGIFTGKGIYEVATLHAVLDRRFPRNALLSHDLIEGAYARAGQVTDVELIDDYPSHYSAYSRRKHRWVRGDWQIAQWMFSHVPDESGKLGQNPISYVSRWKIFDNLRRSLLDPALLILFVSGWLGLPGGPLYWTLAALLLLFLPTFLQLGFAFGRNLASEHKQTVGEIFSAFGHGALVALLNLIFLPHQMMLTLDAIIRSMVRQFVTGERLLEWETAAQAETKSSRRTPVDRYVTWASLVAIGLGILVYYAAPRKDAIYYAAPILVLWACANMVTAWLNKSPQEQQERLTASDRAYLLGHALRIWRYFYQFGGECHNYLIPDNVEEEGLFEAGRVSPTNLGLLLNARQAACELGFLTVPEFVKLTQSTLATFARLEKFRGHLFNWYDTQTLKPLNGPSFVSSVDSGNLVASLYTLHAGALDLIERPLCSAQLFNGIRAHWGLMQQTQGKLSSKLGSIAMPGPTAPVTDSIAWLQTAEESLVTATNSQKTQLRNTWWYEETVHRIGSARTLVRSYAPWLLPEFESLRKIPELGLARAASLSMEDSVPFAESLDARLANAQNTLVREPEVLPLVDELRKTLPVTLKNLRAIIAGLRAIALESSRLADGTDFAFLVDPNRQILSIGYEMSKQKTHEACYDMLASEARIATFLAVARGDLRQESWFKLARDFAHSFGQYLLLSWSGTMFEYLMPSLWMRSYSNTLISRTQAAVVGVQRGFARALGIPWGISESGAARKDDAGHYHYHAYGIPQIALWFEATAGPVVSPYSSFLALGVDCVDALHNLRRMESMGWVGPYGFYESADYTGSLRRPELTREWMAHHHGMSLLAVVNLLCDNVVQRWFHSNALVQSAELLLHEIPTSKGVIRRRLQEFAPVTAAKPAVAAAPVVAVAN
jgi:cyclic beta-1,2-glucan synthetase